MATPSLLTPQEFAGKVRAKYPGAYDSLGDDELTQKVLAKYPQYGGQVQLATPGVPRPQAPAMQLVDTSGKPQNPNNVYSGPGAWPNPDAAAKAGSSPAYQAAVGVPAAVAATVMGGSGALPFLAAAARKHPWLAMAAAQEGVHQARQIPVIGRHIPAAAEWLPFLLPSMLGEGKTRPKIGGEPDATTNSRNVPEYAGEDYGPMQPKAPAQSPQRPNVPFLSYPPEAPATFPPQPPKPTPEALERLETRSIQEQVREQAEAEDTARQRIVQQQWMERNDPSTAKGVQIEQFRTQQRTTPAPTPQTEDDLTPILKKSLAAARKKKPQ